MRFGGEMLRWIVRIRAMLQQDRFDTRMPIEQVNQFRPAVASKADNADACFQDG
jgi:hypothetical protein